MFGKIINFRRPQGVAEGVASGVAVAPVEPDNPFLCELLNEEGVAAGDTLLPKQTQTEAVKEYLDAAMAEICQLYTLAERAPPKRIKLKTLHERYDQLRLSMRWPRLNPDQLSKQLSLNGCKSHRVGKQNVRMIELPAYPAARFK